MQINIEGIIPIVVGLCAYAMVHGFVNVSNNPIHNEVWRKKWSPKIDVLALIAVLVGFLMLFGVFGN